MTDQQSFNAVTPKACNHPNKNARKKKSTNKLFDRDDVHIGIIGSGLAGLSAALSILRAARNLYSTHKSPDTRSLNNANNTNHNDHNANNTQKGKDDNGNTQPTNKNEHNKQKRKQIRITIYERDKSPTDRKEGYGMTITYNPDGPLAKLNLLEEVAKRDCPSRCHYLFDGEGFVRGYFGNAFYDNDNDNDVNVTLGSNDKEDDSEDKAHEAKGEKSVAKKGEQEKVKAVRGAGQRGNIRIPRSELRAILMNALMKEAQEMEIHTNNANSKNDESNDGDGEEENMKGNGVCSFQWDKRLVSYVDRPMESKLDSIFGKSHSQSAKSIVGDETQQRRIPQEQNGEETVQRAVLLNFDDGTTDQVDLLIGADGVNSVVSRQYLSTTLPSCGSKKKMTPSPTNPKQLSSSISTQSEANRTAAPEAENQPVPTASSAQSQPQTEINIAAPRYLGIFLILGISETFHPHIDERGFYTLDGEHRLFIMPYQGSRIDDARRAASSGSKETLKRRRTMWQLSFPVLDFEEAMRLKQLPQSELQKEVLRRCGHWHEPFVQLVKETPLDTIWGTGLLDRDPQIFIKHRQSLEIHGRIPSHVVVIGDASHAMSPFKGQGANQALADGPLLASWLVKSKLDSALRGFMAEMARRSGIKVRASRESAAKLHSADCWEWMAESGYNEFHGVKNEEVPRFLEALKERGVGASLGSRLDDRVRSVIRELGVADTALSSTASQVQLSPQEMTDLQSRALQYASTANTYQLRLVSRMSNLIIPSARDSKERTCLHLAAQNGHGDTCRWLLSEVKVNCHVADRDNKTPLDLALEQKHEEVTTLLKSWTAYSIPHPEQNDPSARDPSTENDVYKLFEKQLRGVRNIKQLCALLRNNRVLPSDPSCNTTITHVVGCPIEEGDRDKDAQAINILAKDHGAVLLRNYIPREIDRLALGALALRPLKFDYSDAVRLLKSNGGNSKSTDKAAIKEANKLVEGIKSRLAISADSNVVVQTNFGPQTMSYNQPTPNNSKSVTEPSSLTSSLGNPTKKRKIDSFPLSKLRYLNIGEWNYNWGDRRYEIVQNAMALPQRLVSLAQHANTTALHGASNSSNNTPISFNMAICNLYHLQRPSDRLGGHKDNVESNLSLPLVTISLGAPGIFLLGGATREDKPTAILLRAGDCMVLSGKSRGYFHGVPTILEHEFGESTCTTINNCYDPYGPIFPELNDDGTTAKVSNNGRNEMTDIPTNDELLFVKAFLLTVRMNLSIRQV